MEIQVNRKNKLWKKNIILWGRPSRHDVYCKEQGIENIPGRRNKRNKTT
jgi:hypothetical protein